MIGRATAWLSLIMVLVMFTIVLMRYVFGISFIWLQESITYMHGLLFMLASAYTLSIDGHVRVDIFYREASEHKKAITNLLGIYLLLFPFMFLIVDMALPYVQTAWEVREGSKETSGIQAIYLLKTVILAFAWTMILQGISLACSAALYLLGAAESQNPFAEDESIQSERASDNG
ncbi:MAG: TRAP transporter small permease subunit [Alphaproteobacteria bacterium]|nr:MAG: TRAP transporter small permease subunit [Alphaproteobacteria bacterium]